MESPANSMSVQNHSDPVLADASPHLQFHSSALATFGANDADIKGAGSEEPRAKNFVQNSDVDEHEESEELLYRDEPEEEEDFDPSQCLFCNQITSDLDANLAHMLKTHGFLIGDKERLVVDVETLLAYFHFIIFGYFECLYCGTQRNNTQAAQQHMRGKGHCKFDVPSEDSELRDFYESAPGDKDDDDTGKRLKRLALHLMQPDDARLPSGKPRKPRLRGSRLGNKNTDPQLEAIPIPTTASQSTSDSIPNQPGSSAVLITRSEKREFRLTNQLGHLRADDRRSLMHLPTSQQRALLTTHKKQMEKARRAERAYQSRMEQVGNKTLMKHFVNDVPGRLNG